MTEITFTVDGVDGEFAADLDELKSYKTVKQFARSETDPAGMMDAMERIFMSRRGVYRSPRRNVIRHAPPVRRGLRGGKDKKLVGFASDLENRRGEAIADFQQFYGIALPLDGAPEDLDRMALLWQHLPDNSRLAKAQYPQLRWSTTDYMLWRIEHQLRCIAWGMADKKDRSAEPPEPIKTPAQLAELERHRANALEAKEEIDKILGIGGEDGD